MTITIDCPKNIKVLHIEFEGDSDSPDIKSNTESLKVKRLQKEVKKEKDIIEYLDTSTDPEEVVRQQIFEKPIIASVERPPMVANDMNKLDL